MDLGIGRAGGSWIARSAWLSACAIGLTHCGDASHGGRSSAAGGRAGGQAGGAQGGNGRGGSAAGGREPGGTSQNGGTSSTDGGSGGRHATGGASTGGDEPTSGTSGTDSAAGTQADGGTGNFGCGASQTDACDDGNPCTVDELSDACDCVHHAANDGTGCDDGNPCTTEDSCSEGQCSGDAVESTPSTLGTLRSFGSGAGLNTIVSLLPNDRALFATYRTLSLVALDGDELEALDHHALNTAIALDQVSSMIWSQTARSWLLPIVGNHAAFVSQNWGIDLYDLTDDMITPSERYSFDSYEGILRAATAKDKRIWTCVNSEILVFDVNPTSYEIQKGKTFALPSGRNCQALSLTPDGSTLLAATSGGLERVDVTSSDGTMTLIDSPVTDAFILELSVTDEYIAFYAITDQISARGDVHVLRADTLEEVAVFAAATTLTAFTPGAFGLLDGGLLMLQKGKASDCPTQAVDLYQLSASGAEKVDSWTTVAACESDFDTFPVHTVALGQHALVEPMHELIRVDPDTHAVTHLRGIEQGSLEQVRATGAGHLEVYGPGSTHLVDFSDPSAPKFTDASLEVPSESERLRIDFAEDGTPSLLTLPETPNTASGPLASLYWSQAAGLPTLHGSLEPDTADAIFFTAGRFVYELGEDDGRSLKLRRFPASAFTHGDAQSPASDLTQTLTPESPSELDRRANLVYAVDAASGDLAIAETRAPSDNPDGATTVLSYFELVGAKYELGYTKVLDTVAPLGVLSAGGEVALLHVDNLTLIDAEGTPRDQAFVSMSGSRLLAFDGQRVSVATYASGVGRVPLVVVYDAETFEELARYEMPDGARSLAVAGDYIVIGMQSAVTVATAACPSN